MVKFGGKVRARIQDALDVERHPRAALPLLVALAIALGFAAREVCSHFWWIPESAYRESVLIFELCRQPVAIALTILFTAILAWPRLCWRRLETQPILRTLMTVASLALAWDYSCAHYNHFFAQEWPLDRALCLGLALCVFLHPAFIVPALAMITVLSRQIDYPLFQYSVTQRQPILDLLWLFWGWLVLKQVAPRVDARRFLFLALCLMGSWYFHAGFAKIRIGWLVHEDLFNLSLAAADNGWPGRFDAEKMATIQSVTRVLNWPMKIFTLVVEVGMLAILWRRGASIALLIGAILLHTGIFLSSGICFWTWAITELTMIGCLLALPREQHAMIWSKNGLVLSLVVIIGSGLWFHPKALGWFDSPLSHVFRIEAIGASGRVFEVAPAQMAPYDFPLTQGRFNYLTKQPILADTYGSVRRNKILAALVGAKTRDDVLQVVREHGKIRTNDDRSAVAARFFSTYFANLNANPRPHSPFSICAPPQHQWTGHATALPPFDASELVARVRVRLVTSRLSIAGAEELESHVVLDVPVAPTSALTSER